MNKTHLVGVLELASKYRYGLTRHGTPLYLFRPYAEDAPDFIVGSNCRDLSVNQIAVVEATVPYECPISPAKPRADLVRLVGPVGDIDAEKKGLLYHYCPTRSAALSLAAATPVEPDTSRDAERIEIDAEHGWCTFHVDPAGCRDIDDAIAIHPATGRWAITIADVAALVPVGSPLDARARAVGATFYDAAGRVVLPMLPAAISEDAASLTPGSRRRGVSLVWSPSCEEAEEAEEPVFVSSWITVTHSFTYETFATSDVAALVGVTPETDTHAWIADLMIRYNAAAARVLKKTGCRSAVLRVQPPALAERVAAWPPVLRHLAAEAAVYVSAGSSTEIHTEHASLGLDAYTHASSPIRRYADLINQRALVQQGHGTSYCVLDPSDIDHLNARAKANKRWGRDITFLTHVTPGRVHEVDVIWIDARRVWVPAWGRVVRLRHEPVSPSASGTAGRIAVYCDPTRRNWKRRILTAPSSTETVLGLAPPSETNTSPAAVPVPA